MTNYISLLVGLLGGAIGFWINTFWMKPLIQYRELRSRILADLVFYADVVNTEGLNEQMKDRGQDRMRALRRHAADLQASILELPAWYRLYLRWRKRDPERVAQRLIGLSNTTDYDTAQKVTFQVMKKLGYTGQITETL